MRGAESQAAAPPFREKPALFHSLRPERNKSAFFSYNRVVAEFNLTEERKNGGFLAYLYNALVPAAVEAGGTGEFAAEGERAAVRIRVPEERRGSLSARAAEAAAEVLCIGYKYRFLEKRLSVCLSARERRVFLAALIAADLSGDMAYVKPLLCGKGGALALDGVWNFRLAALKEKWARIAAYVPPSFASPDLKKFCAFLAGESANKVFLKGNTVYGADFAPRHKSFLTGREDVETEIVLSDAGQIFCLGRVEDGVSDFLQKYYAERAVFS